MAVVEAMREVWTHSGLAELYAQLAPWLALDARQLIFVIATPVFLGVALWEYLRIRSDPRLMDAGEAVRNFMLGAGYQITELLFAGLVAFPVYAFAYHHRLLDIELSWASGALLWVLTDFCFYWFHRASHRVRWFWCAHVTHHSSERMNFSTAMRQNATNIFNGGWLFYVPLAFIGFNPVWIGVCYALSLVYQFFIHTTLVGRLHPAIEYLFNTPNHHRVHHASNPGYIDTNYGGVFIVFDRWFGTFAAERAGQPIRYGITRPVHTTSLIVSWTHEYVDMLRDMLQPGALAERLRHLWMPPEWQRMPATHRRAA
jgi:sterol desaturase/sphingolipid hydroxylase (fatty acid hydroxylase superfamily)